MKHVGIEIKFYNLDTFKKQIDVNFIDLDSELVDLNYKVASLIFCHFWRSIWSVFTVLLFIALYLFRGIFKNKQKQKTAKQRSKTNKQTKQNKKEKKMEEGKKQVLSRI